MIEIGSALDPGKKRTTGGNQDAVCVVKPGLFGQRPPLLVLADGMGGYEGGSTASRLVVNSFSEVFSQSRKDTPPLQILQTGVTAALQAMKHQAAADPALAKMGSTVVAAVVKGPKIYLLNVGDSRAYLVNASGMRQLSYDHSLVADQLRMGLIQEEDIRVHPRRNVLSMSISAQRELVESFTGTFDWRSGDRLVLCSDGLWGPVEDAQIQSTVLELRPQQAASRLVELANENQGPDNISVIVAEYR